ncbi:hypothetical protein DAPPUDRAFT_257168 [Daphnia pulex]|uniref:S1 motif domain-containing protein n=1 Tax=Daphnia pulex TaxID=6669 RepID=E9HCZ0_DAPPU|nr:hypothetical protein DAPPUDRAFT_257168 [Daphnia pulex]|eukprot:EFX70437.1 hypothetical protein DAPPUDRAFT_257168 [Daphnia pulex]
MKPHVIAVSAESREATMLVKDLRAITAQLVEDNQWPLINIELVDTKVFAFSTRAETEFREYPQLLREAISFARRLQILINCAGLIKIDTNSLADSAKSSVEVLDGSRVHPESYDWACQMAVAALKYDDEDVNPDGAVEQILEAPERLKTFFIDKLVLATVTDIKRRKPNRQELNRAKFKQKRNYWLVAMPVLSNDFTDLSKVWIHLDAGSCSGQVIGVHIRFENGLSGFLPMKCLSDSEVKTPEERFRPGQTIHCRISYATMDRLEVESSPDFPCLLLSRPDQTNTIPSIVWPLR